MSFEMDLDTFNDLEIFTQREGSKSIFSIFNRTRTAGGKAALTEMMRKPSSDVISLINRRDSIRYFHQQNIELTFSYNQLDMIEHYLTFNKRILRNNFLDALYDHWSNKINTTNDYYIITAGISALIKLLRFVAELAKKITAGVAPNYLSNRVHLIQNLLENKIIKQIIQSPEKTSCFQLNRMDQFFRKKESGKIKELLKFVYEIDVYKSAAEVLRDEGWSLPEYCEETSEEIEILELRHPAINYATPNDIHLNEDKSVVFLTGPNMAGKSSFLKSIGLAVFLAHIGFPVPATKMKTPLYKGLLTTINLPDNIYDGSSHYYSEVKRIKKTALKILETDSMFVIFDELFRGTNVKDAFDASLLVITNLSKIKNCKFLISTHITELAEHLRKLPNISFKYFESSFNDGNPSFSYKIKEGVSDKPFLAHPVSRQKRRITRPNLSRIPPFPSHLF